MHNFTQHTFINQIQFYYYVIFERNKQPDQGGDLYNRRYAYKERKINPETAPNLRLKWKFNAGKDITANNR